MRDISTLNNNDFYYCYSIELANFLDKKFFRWLCVGLHPVSRRKFFQFLRTDALREALEEYTRDGYARGLKGVSPSNTGR